ncbi:hypothetical protein [Aeromonas hydrophila]|uniref:hypothetical protein n=1 Tax=Aeromonas hydrophila TaxID=644 RepID=UPI00131A540C|nr:hypothetical protein [Aeromonas hydrophila]
MEYESYDELDLDYEILPVINNFFTKTSDFSKIKNQDSNFDISFFCKDEIRNEKHDFILSIKIETMKNGHSRINKTKIALVSEALNINEFDLKSYIEGLYYRILINRNGRDRKDYVVRVYSKIYNSHPIKGEYIINYRYKTLLKPAISKSKREPCTEHIVFFDVSLDAINIEHARTLAIEHVYDLQSFLSVMLDFGFEFVNSEFRTFVFHKRVDLGSHISTQRYRTGFFDEELNLFVCDNLNHLRHIDDKEDMDGFFSGKVSMQLVNEDDENKERFYFDASKKPNLEKAFENREISKPNVSCEEFYKEGISKDFHFTNMEIKVPREIRKYFRGLSALSTERKNSFTSCARMYNLALKLHKSEPTAFASYLVCAVESLAKCEELAFSEFLKKYGGSEYNKPLCDHYYSLRSSHFHSGKFHFHENNPSLMTETDSLFYKKINEFNEFYKNIRVTIVNWIEQSIL